MTPIEKISIGIYDIFPKSNVNVVGTNDVFNRGMVIFPNSSIRYDK